MQGMEPVPCPICGADDYRVRYPSTLPETGPGDSTPDHYCCTSHHLGIHNDIVQCNNCGMIYNNPQPTPEALEAIYKEVEDPLYSEESGARERTFRRSLRQLHLFAQPPGKLLDIGCYTGVFIQEAANGGWQTEGLELGAWAAGIARKKELGKIYGQTLEQLELPENSYDAVTLWDVIEHLNKPGDMMAQVHRILKPGGVVAFSTHMADSWAVKLMGKRYPFFMEMHVVHFSRKTTRKLLEQQGFELLKIKPHHRILRVGYFLEKLYHKVKLQPFHGLLKWMSRRKWLADRFIGIGMLGLVNIFAKKRVPTGGGPV